MKQFILVLDKLGIQPLINCTGNETVLGGTRVDDSVIEAMKEAGRVFVDMPELQRRAGEYVAKLLGCEDAFISGGAEAGLVIALAACMTRSNLRDMAMLPDTSNLRNEVIIQSLHRNMYDYNLLFTGARIVEIGTKEGTSKEDLERAINEKTVAIFYVVFDPQTGVLPLEEVSKIANTHSVPIIADAAAELPPVENLKLILERGADIVVFSGGKDIGAPNDAGLVIGRTDLIQSCRLLGPHSYQNVDSHLRVFIGRPMKTSKEDILAFIQALQNYLNLDQKKRLEDWENIASFMMSKLKSIAGIKIRKIYEGPEQPRPAYVPKVEIELPPSKISAEDIVSRLRNCSTPIACYSIGGRLYLNPQCLKNGEEELVIRRVLELLQ